MFYRLPGKEEARAAIWRARYTGCRTCSKEGIEKERQERLQSLRQTIIDLVQARYPKLLKLAKGQTLIIEQPKTLELLLVRVAQAATLEDTQDALLTWEEQ